MKRIVTFEVSKEMDVDEESFTKDESGNEIKTIKKVKKVVPQKFFIRKPNREIKEEAELFYNKIFAEGVKAGLLTHTLLAKRYNADGGILTEGQKEEYVQLYSQLGKLEEQYQKAKLKPEQDLSEEEKNILKNYNTESLKIQNQIYQFNIERQTVFNSTAETRAKNKTIVWYALNLAYCDDSNDTPFFGTGGYEERIRKYDEISEDEGGFLYKVAIRFLFLTTLWFESSGITEKELINLLESFDKEENFRSNV